jgi:hypothetical protein
MARQMRRKRRERRGLFLKHWHIERCGIYRGIGTTPGFVAVRRSALKSGIELNCPRMMLGWRRHESRRSERRASNGLRSDTLRTLRGSSADGSKRVLVTGLKTVITLPVCSRRHARTGNSEGRRARGNRGCGRRCFERDIDIDFGIENQRHLGKGSPIANWRVTWPARTARSPSRPQRDQRASRRSSACIPWTPERAQP